MLSRALPLLISSAPPPTAVSPTPPHCLPLLCGATPRSTTAGSLLQPFPVRSPLRGPTSVRLPFGVRRTRHFSVHRGGGGGGMGHGVVDVSYLTQKEATEIDEILMGPLGFGVDQLMELAGLSVAASIAEVYRKDDYGRVLTICGPGNNGGDGLVAARHLYHFGYKPVVCYPKCTPKMLYTGLVTQLEALSIPFLSVEELPQDLSSDFHLIVDAMFGFSFQDKPKPPFDDLIQRLVLGSSLEKPVVIVSVDIPSGWDVEEGDKDGEGIKPDMLVSLTAPKLCAKKFSGPHHFLGGRFLPPLIADKFALRLPPYPGASMCVRIGKHLPVDVSAMRENYTCPEFLEDQVMADPIDQFRVWLNDAVAARLREPNAMALSTADKEGKPFLPPLIADKFALRLPPYPGASMCVRIGKHLPVDVSAMRENYTCPEFLEDQVMADPIDQFRVWLNDAVAARLREPNAMALSTADKEGKPSSRMVLLKDFDENGFVWGTNYRSRKAHDLSENPCASLLFYWDSLNRQVRIEGTATKVSEEESERYFHSRPHGSQLGAIVCEQISIVAGRHVLHQAYAELQEKYPEGSLIPKPEYWGGYRLTPSRFEFWQGQPSRLPDRLQYSPKEVTGKRAWQIDRLAP